MDEAVLRIVMQEGGAGGTASAGPPPSAPQFQPPSAPHYQPPQPPRQRTAPSAPPSGGGFDPLAEAQKRVEAERRRALVEDEYAKLIVSEKSWQSSLRQADPAAEAQKRLEREKHLAAVEAEYAKIRPVEAPFDPAVEAQKWLERDQKRRLIEAEYAKLVPSEEISIAEEAQKWLERDQRRAEIEAEYARIAPWVEPVFDPVARAKERLEKDKEREAIDAEYAKLKPPPSFDPFAEAQKRREKERREALIEESYEKQFGGDEKETRLDQLLKVVNPLRGTIGGVFGTITGAVTDLVTGLRKAEVEAAKVRDKHNLLRDPIDVIPAAGTAGAARAVVASGVTGGGTAAGTGAAAGAAVAGVIAAAVATFVVAVKALIETAERMNKQYGEYSPQIAQAQAVAEIRQTMGDVKRAQVLGSSMAKYVLARSELQQKWEDVKARFMQAILPMVTGIVKMLEFFLPKVIEDDEREVMDPTEALLGEDRANRRVREGMVAGVGEFGGMR